PAPADRQASDAARRRAPAQDRAGVAPAPRPARRATLPPARREDAAGRTRARAVILCRATARRRPRAPLGPPRTTSARRRAPRRRLPAARAAVPSAPPGGARSKEPAAA